MNRKAIFPLILLASLFASLAIVLTGCGSKEPAPTDKTQEAPSTNTSTITPKINPAKADKSRDDSGTILVKSLGFSIDNPKNWTIETDNGDPEVPLILTQKDGNTTANIVVVVEKVDDLLTSKTNFEASLASLNATLKDYNKISEGRVGDFYSVTFTHSSGSKTVKQTVYNQVKDGKGYTIAATDFIETFDSNAPLLEKMAASFKLQ